MRTVRILIAAFLGGVILASCGRVVEPNCRVTGVDTLRVPSDDRQDTATVILGREVCG